MKNLSAYRWLLRPLTTRLVPALAGLALLATAAPAQAQTPTFAPVVPYSTGANSVPESIAVADVNGDGRPDLLTANHGTSNAGVLLGNGDGTFQAVVPYSTGTNSGPTSIAVADVNGDTKPDLLTANFNTNTAGVLLGNGDGTFQPVVPYSTGAQSFPESIAVADVNGDRKPDLLTANNGTGTAGVLLGNGDGTFQPVVPYSTGANNSPQSIAVADVNGDTKPDLLTANSSTNTAGVLLGNGDGTFQPVVPYSTGPGSHPVSIAVADVNGDTKPDLLTANAFTSNAVVLLGNGDGTFQAVVPYYTGPGSYPISIAVADVNGDGKPDLLTANLNTFTAGVLLGNGDGTFQAVVPYDTGTNSSPHSIAVADVNGDGKPDLLTANSNLIANTAGVLLNTTVFAAPTLTSLNPTSGPVGTSVTLTGTFLTGATGISFNGTAAATFAVVNATTATATVPPGTTTGNVTITTPGGTSNGIAFTVLVAPTLTSISPTSGVVGSTVTLTGTNLSGATSVRFNGTTQTTISSNTATSLTVVVPAGTTTGNVTVTTPGGTSNGIAFTITTTAVTWTGAVSTDWATAGNWSPAVVPTNTIDATIPAAPNQPVASGTQAAKNVTLQAGANLTLAATTAPTTQLTLGSSGNGSLTLAAGSTLTQGAASELYITGNLTNNGATFALNATSEIGFGITTTNHLLNGTTGVTFQTLTVGEQGIYDNLSIRVPVRVLRKLGVYHNSTTSLGMGGTLTLLSDATGTALVENGDAGSTVGGPVTMQRYIDPSLNPGLGYRHYSAPVSGATVVDLTTTTGFTPVLTAGYNTSATPGTTTPFPTVFAYDQARLASTMNNLPAFDKGFVVPVSTDVPLAVGQGYAVNIDAAQLVSFKGTLTTGPQTVNLARTSGATAADGGWALVGNPYPAPLDLSLIALGDRPGLDAAMYVFESSTQYTGMYRSYVNSVGILPRSARTSGALSSSPFIGSSQGFFVRVSAGLTSGSLTFRDAQRLTSYATPVPVRRSSADQRPLVQLELRGATGPADPFYAYAEAGATPAFDSQFDAVKLPNTTGLNLASRAEGAPEGLAIDARPVFTAATVLPLTLGVPAAGAYTLSAAALMNLPAGLDAYLHDAVTGQTINLGQQPRYAFAISPAQAQAGLSTRFSLGFSPQAILATHAGLHAGEVSLFPNPAHDSFTVLVPAVTGTSQLRAELLNALGQVVRRLNAALSADGASLHVDTAGLAGGVYILRLSAGPTTLTKRVVLQ